MKYMLSNTQYTNLHNKYYHYIYTYFTKSGIAIVNSQPKHLVFQKYEINFYIK